MSATHVCKGERTMIGFTWYDCGQCDLSFHGGCLSVRELVTVVVSLNEEIDLFCKGYRPWLYKE